MSPEGAVGTARCGGATKEKEPLGRPYLSHLVLCGGDPTPRTVAAAAGGDVPRRPPSRCAQLSSTAVHDLSDMARAVLQNLTEQPTLNTPALIASGGAVEAERPEIERALDELVAAGYVKHRPTGWKVAPEAT